MGLQILIFDMIKREITQEQYLDGVFDICDSLVTDLLKFLKDEGRYKYRMIGYMRSITDSFEKNYDTQTDEDIEVYERILYLLHKSIYIDYRRLRLRRLSPADSVICLILKLISISEEYQEKQNFPGLKEIFQGFHENIKNRGKLDKLVKTETTLRQAIEEKSLGKLRMSDLNLYLLEHPQPKSQKIIGEQHEWGETEGKEIEL